MTLVKRLVKGTALTYAEADGNLDHFTDAIALKADLEAELISGGETTVDGTTVAVAAATWRVPPSTYATVAETEFTSIANSATGMQRYVAFYGTTSNTITKVEGSEDVIAVLPTQPADTALISYVLVGDAGIGTPTQDTTGFQLKSEKSTSIVTDQASNTQYPSVKAVYDWAIGLFQTLANKDATGGYAGLTLFKINFKNAANTFTSFFTNANTAARTYTFQDKDGTIAGLDDTTLSATASGTDTYTATISPAITVYVINTKYAIKFTNANTGASTINLNSLGAKSIVKSAATALVSGDIVAGEIKFLVYDGTNFQIVGGSGGGGSSYTFSTGLTNSSGTVTNNLSTGVSGGQTAIGGTAASNSLTLSSTSHATKGTIMFGTSAYDEVNNRLGIGIASPEYSLHLVKSNSNYERLRIQNTGTGGVGMQFVANTTNSASNSFFTAGGNSEMGVDVGGTFRIATGNGDINLLGTKTRLSITATGETGIRQYYPTAFLHLGAGVAAANGAPLKLSRFNVPTTGASGNGTTATITFDVQSILLYVGSTVTISGVTPSGYNGTYTVTASTSNSVSFANTTTGAQTVAGTVTQGELLTTPENGALEYDGTFHLTNSDVTRRHIVLAPNTTKTTAGAPYTNDGYVTINIGGTDFKIMTTA